MLKKDSKMYRDRTEDILKQLEEVIKERDKVLHFIMLYILWSFYIRLEMHNHVGLWQLLIWLTIHITWHWSTFFIFALKCRKIHIWLRNVHFNIIQLDIMQHLLLAHSPQSSLIFGYICIRCSISLFRFIQCICWLSHISHNNYGTALVTGYLYKRGVSFGELKKSPRQRPVSQTDPGDGRALWWTSSPIVSNSRRCSCSSVKASQTEKPNSSGMYSTLEISTTQSGCEMDEWNRWIIG